VLTPGFLSAVFDLLRTLLSGRLSSNSSAIWQEERIPLRRLWLKIEEVRSRQSAKRRSEKPEVKVGSLSLESRKGMADFVGRMQGPLFASTQSEDVGKQEFSGKVSAATNFAATLLGSHRF
jgi:hypothetical protein